MTLPVPTSGSYKYLQYVLFDLDIRHETKLFQAHIATSMYDIHGRHGLERISEHGSEAEPYYVTVKKNIQIGWRSRFSVMPASGLTPAK